MIHKNAEELGGLVQRIFIAAGASEENASIVAAHLVRANLSGVDTHGVWHVKGYVDAIQEELILPTANPELTQEGPQHALVSGNWTFGQVAARFGAEVVIEKAKAGGMATVGLVQCHHIGRLGHYPEMATDAGVILMVWAGGYGEEAPASVPYGGRERLLHTNPLSIGVPAGDEPPMMFDYATTALSGVKVDNARTRGESLPPGAIVDKEGRPSTDPNDFFDGGAHLPFGGHKGYAIMMATEYLGSILTGSKGYADERRAGPIMRQQGVTFIAVKADLFQPLAEFEKAAAAMSRRARAVPPAPGFDEVLVPGDPESRTRAARERDGIPIHEHIWENVVAAAEAVGVSVD